MSVRQSRNVRRWRSRAQRKDRSSASRAISTIVATLILVLVAVAAAAALYLWLVDWQKGVTGSIGPSNTAQPTLSIGGSTSVYPFTQLAVTQFEQNHSDVAVSNSQGGSGAGMLAVCAGHVDVGATSSLVTPASLVSADNCPQSAVVTTVAYDAVDVVFSQLGGNPGITSINASILLGIYLTSSSTVGTLPMPGYLAASGWVAGTPLHWNDIPLTQGCLIAGPAPGGVLPPTGTGNGCTMSSNVNPIDTVTRTDPGGTTQSFEARLLGATSATAVATSPTGLGWSGCGSSNNLGDCGITPTKNSVGNPGVIATVAGDKNAIGFASDGLARAAGSGVSFVAFAPVGSGLGATAVLPTLGHTGTISLGIQGLAGGYVGWRPFQYVTLGAPTGEAAVFINYVLDPSNNQNFASESQEVSIYQV